MSSRSTRLTILHLSVLLAFLVAPRRSEGQFEEWCIADEQVPDDELQRALDWACGKGGANCGDIQVKRPCFYPDTVRDHASYAFNSYYQKFKHKGASCFFNSAAMVTALDPSHGSCKFEYVP
ncbi:PLASMODESMATA CALLOSE-BINDING PROTEIN 5-like isoform X2 [Cucurbita maxima]|uniref:PLASMODESMATA CALLOSE-BINDING PROTEIN 5-like n=1 Tax=Cucurbita maxima TaxID=3661 RepID=A0A6J1HUR1_CUCMA|nr:PLASMODESMATA CALLOSE-BINDING PROTEIN 5-like [Cucurbita maxima]XP_022966758.1 PLASMODESMATA CALLOSE-BINDING PROTEIN 5-like isoform X1 [Cucurbita maxima]XP_022966759.1 PLASMODESMATA CALLOSE-BINDING PROTEIN 5-like isoform X2 [Cucurbita maxima]